MAQLPDRRPGRGKNIPDAGEYALAGLLLFTFAGSWLDRRLGTSPWLLLAGVAAGFALSSFWIYRQLVISPRERAKEKETDRP